MLSRPAARIHALLAFSVLWLAPSGASAQELAVHFIDIGQGNATLVEAPDGTRVLIDGGAAGEGTGTIVPYLQSHGITDLEYSIATHWHSDHIGGMDEVFNAGYLPTLAAYDRGDFNIPTNGHVTGYLAAVGGQRQQPNVGFTVFLGGGATMEFVAENGNYPGGAVNPWSGSQGENASSIAVVIRYGDFDLWIGGDLTGGGNGTVDVESGAGVYVGQVEVVLSNHHGSRTSSNSAFVSSTQPSLVVHSAGHDNPYGHPKTQVLDHWNSPAASRVQWCTTAGDTTNGSGGFVVSEGHIQVRTDGTTFSVTRVAGGEVVRLATFELAATAPSSGDLVISEVLVDPAASADAYGEWFELVNTASTPLDLLGLRVESGADQFTLASRLMPAPGERLVFGVDGRQSRNGQVFLDHGAPWQTFSLGNGSDALALRSAGGTVLETVVWGSGGFSHQPGIAKERINLAAPPNPDNFADALTAWAGADLGTPREVNDNEEEGCAPAENYCIGAPNSVGLGADIDYSGSLDVLQNDLVLSADGAPASQFGIFFYGPNAVQLPFGDGYRCVGGALYRFPVVQLDGAGAVSYAVDLTSPPQASGQIEAGSTWYFQFWYRDPAAGGTGFNLSNGLEATFCSANPPVDEGALVITEMMIDPTAAPDEDGEWLEVYNASGATLDLAGFELRDEDGDAHVFGPFTVAAGARAVLGRSADTAQNGNVPVDYAYGADFTLDEAADEVVLVSDTGLEIDRVEYSAGFFPTAAGRSSSLDAGILDHELNDNAIYWCLSTTPIAGGPDQGTPGAVNDDCP